MVMAPHRACWHPGRTPSPCCPAVGSFALWRRVAVIVVRAVRRQCQYNRAGRISAFWGVRYILPSVRASNAVSMYDGVPGTQRRRDPLSPSTFTSVTFTDYEYVRAIGNGTPYAAAHRHRPRRTSNGFAGHLYSCTTSWLVARGSRRSVSDGEMQI